MARPINIDLQRQLEKTIGEFVSRNFGQNGKVAQLNADAIIRLENKLVDKYMPKFYTPRNSDKRIYTRPTGNKRAGIKKFGEGGIAERQLNKLITKEANTEQLVKRLFGKNTAEKYSVREKRRTEGKSGLKNANFVQVLKSIISNHTEFYDWADEATIQEIRDYNRARAEAKAEGRPLSADGQRASARLKARYQQFQDEIAGLIRKNTEKA